MGNRKNKKPLLDTIGRRNRKLKDIKCRHCGKKFRPRFRHIKCCSKKCGYASRNTDWNKANRRTTIFMSSGGYKTRSYWVKNRRITIREHRYVMEQKLGRKLLKIEVVHHINNIKTDNRPENLEVMTKAAHMRLHKTQEWDKIKREKIYP